MKCNVKQNPLIKIDFKSTPSKPGDEMHYLLITNRLTYMTNRPQASQVMKFVVFSFTID